MMMADAAADGSVGKPFTGRDELAFTLYQALVNGRMSDRDACEEGKSLAKLAYKLTDDFLVHRRDA
jgi:hypothetical protein